MSGNSSGVMMMTSVKSLVREYLLCDGSQRSIPHVRVKDTATCASNSRFVEAVQRYLAEFPEHANSSYWLSGVPACLHSSLEETVNYLGMLVAIDFRHWGEHTDNEDMPRVFSDAEAGRCVERFTNFYVTLPYGENDRHAEKGFPEGHVLRGSMAMVHLLRCAVEQYHVHWYCPSFINQFSSTEEAIVAMKCCFLGHEEDGKTPMWMPATRERVELLTSLSRAQVEKDTSFYKMWCRSNGYLYHPKDPHLGFINQLLELHPRYRDFCVLRSDTGDGNDVEVPVLKLAQLTASALENAVSEMHSVAADSSLLYNNSNNNNGHHRHCTTPQRGAFNDKNQLTVCCDYQIPKALRLLEFIEYDEYLESLVDSGVLLEPNGVEETSIRVSSLIATEKLLEYLCETSHNNAEVNYNEHELRRWNGPTLDHMLWWIGRHYAESYTKHHLCRTIMY